jgi:hypothetical protein
MKVSLTLTVIFAGLLLATGLLRAAGDPAADASQKIRELHKQRIATLQQAADLLNTEYKDDRRSYDELCQGRLLLVYAKLAAAETGEDRVKLHESIVAMMKEKEDLLVQALKLDNVDALNVLNAKAERLKAELGLEEARISAGKPAK